MRPTAPGRSQVLSTSLRPAVDATSIGLQRASSGSLSYRQIDFPSCLDEGSEIRLYKGRWPVHNAAGSSTIDCKPLIYNTFSTPVTPTRLSTGRSRSLVNRAPRRPVGSELPTFLPSVYWPLGDVRVVGLVHQDRHLDCHADHLKSTETTLTVSTCLFRNPMTVPAAGLTVSAICPPERSRRRTLCQW